MPSTAASSGSSASSRRRSPRSLPYDVEFSLTRTSSRTPRSASQRASASSSSGGRETNAPRKDGIAQNEHRRSQPEASLSGATGESSSRRRSSGGVQPGTAAEAGPWPGTATAPAAAGRCTGVTGSSVRRSRGVCATSGRPASTSSSRSPISGYASKPSTALASGRLAASSAPYRSARHPTATTGRSPSAAASTVSIESFLALATKAQVLTTTTSASSSSATSQPPAASRPASSSESTSLRAQPRVTKAARRG